MGYNTNRRTCRYTGEFVEQRGSNYQRKEGVNYFQSETYEMLLAIRIFGQSSTISVQQKLGQYER